MMRLLLAALGAHTAAALPPAGAEVGGGMRCLPFGVPGAVPARQGTLCTNATDACYCDAVAGGTPRCAVCVALPCLNQTWRMADASGIKLSVDRLATLTAIRPERVDLGDLTGCRFIPGTHWCLWLTDNVGQPILGGTCVPRACSPEQQYNLREILSLLYIRELAVLHNSSARRTETQYAAQALGSTPSMDTVGVHCSTEKDGGTLQRRVWDDAGAVAVAAALCAALGASILAAAALTARDALAAWRQGDDDAALLGSTQVSGQSAVSHESVAPTRGPGTAAGSAGGSANRGACVINPESDSADGAPSRAWRRPLGAVAGCVWGAASCFDLRAHFAALVRVGPRRPTSFLHGFRVWSIMWVLLGHTGDYPHVPGVDNIPQVVGDYTQSFRDVLMYGEPAVDTFFYMSGFLGCYLLIPRWPTSTRSVAKNMWMYLFIYIDRWVRLTPVYALCIWVNYHLIQYMVIGPLSILAKDGQLCGDCSEDWWRNLLYINTIPKADGQLPWCLSHSWYLGDDMFFVWMFTPLVILYVYRKKEALAVTLLAMALSLAYGVYYGHSPPGETPDGEKSYYYPWGRAPPYLWGLVAAFALRHEPARARIQGFVAHWARRLVVYAAATGMLGGIVVWQWWTEKSDPQFVLMEPWADVSVTSSYMSAPLSPAAWRAKHFAYYFGWGLGLMLLTFVWSNGHGGLVVAFLSHPLHELLGRLTYGVYLVHPMILTILKLSLVTTALPHYTDYWLLTMVVTAGFASFLSAALLNVFVERPVAAAWDLATAKSKRNRTKA